MQQHGSQSRSARTPRRLDALEPDGIVWHKSSDCGEVAPAPAGVLVRDSKNADGPMLAVTTTAWQAFLTTFTR